MAVAGIYIYIYIVNIMPYENSVGARLKTNSYAITLFPQLPTALPSQSHDIPIYYI